MTRNRQPAADAAPPEAAEPQSKPEPKKRSEPRRDAEAANQQGGSNENRNRGRGGRGRRRDDLGPPVKGLGDHVPAFLNIELPELKSTRKKAAAEAEEATEGTGDEAA